MSLEGPQYLHKCHILVFLYVTCKLYSTNADIVCQIRYWLTSVLVSVVVGLDSVVLGRVIYRRPSITVGRTSIAVALKALHSTLSMLVLRHGLLP